MPSPRHGTAVTVATTLTILLSVSACGSDSPAGITGDALNAAETQQLVGAFFAVLELIDIPLLETAPAAVARPAATPYGELYDDQVGGVTECEGGGSASVEGLITGDVDQEAGTAALSMTATADFAGCVVPGETTTFTLNGDPDIGLTSDLNISPSAISIDIDTDGYVAFETDDGRSGSCRLNFGVSASATSSGIQETLSGTVCGVNASSLDVSLFN